MVAEWDWLHDEMQHLHAAQRIRPRRSVKTSLDGWCEWEGERLRNFASNDYLNLAHDPRVIAAAQSAIEIYGAGATASALVCGRTPLHEELEARLAEFEGQESAVLFPSGFAANVGTLSALMDARDVVFCDKLNHASLIDGCRFSGAKFRVYRHDELEKLAGALSRENNARHRWIVTDSVFSMDGDTAPLPELVGIAEEFDARIILDEAHGTGVFGEHGRGVAEWQGVEDQIAVRVGTLSKALGSLGGFVVGEKILTDWLWHSARTQMFSTALPPGCCAAAIAALEIVQEEPWRRENVLALAAELRDGLRELDFHIPINVASPIVPVILNEEENALKASEMLRKAGCFVPAIRPPTVPAGSSRLRISLTAGHERNDVARLLEIFETLPQKLPIESPQ